MRLRGLVTAMVASGVAFGPMGAPALSAQSPQEHQHATEQAQAQPDMMARCKAMMDQRDKMMAEMKAADAQLDDLVTKMNAASGAAKVDATATVVTRMVSQHRTMRDGMMKMQDGMMAHMMEHMQAGADSMTMCPMMKTMTSTGGAKH